METKKIKMRLLSLDKTQTDLLMELRLRGYPKLKQPQLCAYIGQKLATPMEKEILVAIDKVLTEWESKQL